MDILTLIFYFFLLFLFYFCSTKKVNKRHRTIKFTLSYKYHCYISNSNFITERITIQY